MEDAGWRGPQTCKIVGITYRQLDYWTRTGLVVPSVAAARGSGTQRLYSFNDLLQLKVIKRLLDDGVSLQRARQAIECLRGAGGDLHTTNLILNGSRSLLASTGEEIVDLLKGGQGVLNIVPLAGVVDELQAAILKFAPAAARQPGEGETGHVPGAASGG